MPRKRFRLPDFALEIDPRGSCRSRGRSHGRTRGSTGGPTRCATHGPTRGSNSFSLALCVPHKRTNSDDLGMFLLAFLRLSVQRRTQYDKHGLEPIFARLPLNR